MLMDALVIEKHGQAALGSAPRPAPPDDGVLIKVHYSGVSIGTEMLQGVGRHGTLVPPFVAGYQATGEIIDRGQNAGDYQVGEHVAIFCSGSHASYAVAPATRVHRLDRPDRAPQTSLFVQPCVGANALDQAYVRGEDTVLVIGQGMVGQSTAQLARMRGCYVVASDVSEPRLKVARESCADWVINAAERPVPAQTAPRFPNGFAVVMETTGRSGVLDDAIASCAQAGRLSMVGYHPGTLPLPFDAAHKKELHVLFPWFIGKHDLRLGVIRLIESGAFPMDSLISHSVHWRESQPLYQSLFTPARDALNAIVIDWRDAS